MFALVRRPSRGSAFRVHLDHALADAVARAGAHLACRIGCVECCTGPFPISALDAEWLREGMHELERDDPRRAQAVRERARGAVGSLRVSFPGDVGRGLLADDEERVERWLERHGSVPCPALAPGTGACDLYAWRPVPCRTFGPPSRDALGDAPPCRLCFAGASAEDVERCRVSFDAAGVEDALVAAAEAEGPAGDTVVAWVLAGDLTPRRRR